jgi:hypothetical protein
MKGMILSRIRIVSGHLVSLSVKRGKPCKSKEN